jgi:hypothetical protein
MPRVKSIKVLPVGEGADVGEITEAHLSHDRSKEYQNPLGQYGTFHTYGDFAKWFAHEYLKDDAASIIMPNREMNENFHNPNNIYVMYGKTYYQVHIVYESSTQECI